MVDFTFSEPIPTHFLNRAAAVYGDRTAVVDGELQFTYAERGQRCQALTGLLAGLGVASSDRLAVLATNTHVLLEMHNAVPLRGAVLAPLNIRLSEAELADLLGRPGSSLLVLSEDDAHPDVVESAVVGVPYPKWAEAPAAFVTVRPGARPSADDIAAHVRRHLAGFKVPRQVRFIELPKTSTGGIQKQVLRTAAQNGPDR